MSYCLTCISLLGVSLSLLLIMPNHHYISTCEKINNLPCLWLDLNWSGMILWTPPFCSGQHGHPDWSVVVQPHTQQNAMRCIFWNRSIRTSIFGNFELEYLIYWIGPLRSAFNPQMHWWLLAVHVCRQRSMHKRFRYFPIGCFSLQSNIV